MTFTFGSDLTVARDYVRFHSGDVVEAESLLSDELIASLIATTGSNNRAVIAAIRYKIARFSNPNFSADWLTVDNRTAVQSLRELLKDKSTELGVSMITATVTHVYRADSAATEEPDYSDGRP